MMRIRHPSSVFYRPQSGDSLGVRGAAGGADDVAEAAREAGHAALIKVIVTHVVVRRATPNIIRRCCKG